MSRAKLVARAPNGAADHGVLNVNTVVVQQDNEALKAVGKDKHHAKPVP
jgi:hypothetical protein